MMHCFTTLFSLVLVLLCTLFCPSFSAASSALSLGTLDDALVLVATMDGALHALDMYTGSLKWTWGNGVPLVSVFNHESVERLIPSSLDGSLFSFDGGKLERMGVDIQELVNRVPSVNEEHAWTGAKSARLFLIDLENGEVVRELSSDFFLDRATLPSNLLLVGRADYSLQGTDRVSPLKVQLWNLSYSTFIADSSMETSDDPHPYFVSWEPGTTSVVARAKKGDRHQKRQWELNLSAIPVALFRVQHMGSSSTLVQVRDFLKVNERHQSLLLLGPGQGGIADIALPGSKPPLLITDGSPKKPSHLSTLLHATVPLLPATTSGGTTEWNPHYQGIPFRAYPVMALLLLIASLGGVWAMWWRARRWPSSDGAVAPTKQKANKKKKRTAAATTPQPSLSKILVKDRVLGYGSGGTVVYEGTLEGRRIAVKRMLKAFFDVAERETQILMHGDSHPNVVSYFLREEDSEFVYLALSRGCTTLAGVFFDGSHKDMGGEEVNMLPLDDEARLAVDRVRANLPEFLAGIVRGVAHLHSLGIVHRDLKPHNILIDSAGCPLVSDMGLARKLDQMQHTFSTASSGTQGWQAPEVMALCTTLDGAKRLRGRVSMAVDVWGLGLIIYYTLSQGDHPFGDRVGREVNLLQGNRDLRKVHDDPLALDLICRCLEMEPQKRPSLLQMACHPFFWDSLKRLHFLMDVSDLLEANEENVAVAERFEQSCRGVIPVGTQWTAMLPPLLLENLGRYRRYTNSVKDLLRVIRNKSHHFRELPDALREELGGGLEGFVQFFCSLFPNLLLGCFNFIATSEQHRNEDAFARYFFTHQ